MATYYQLIPAKLEFSDGNGDPYSGGKLYFYEAGTSTPLEVYKTASGTAHASPIVLDSQGRVPDSDGIFMPPSSPYKEVLHDVNDVEIYSVDNLVTYGGDGTVTYAMIQDLSANVLLGSIAGGTVEEISLTAAGRALLDDANAAAQLVTLGLTATAAELNHMDGVTSAVQTQLDAMTTSIAAKATTLFGKIDTDSTILKGSGGFTSSNGGTGIHTITFDSAITEDYVVVISVNGLAGSTVYTTSETSTAFTAISRDDENLGVPTSRGFSFILTYNPS